MDRQNEYVFIGATLIDGSSYPVLENSWIHIKDGKILTIRSADTDIKPPTTATIVDVKGKFIIPGLIDSHIHFFQSSGLYTRPDGLDLRHIKSYENEQTHIKESLPSLFSRYLACGVTGVVDCGGPMYNFDIKAMSTKTGVFAPDIEVAGPLASTVPREKLDIGDPPIIKVNTAEEARLLVKQCADKKPVFMKIWFIYQPESFASDTEKVAAVIEESKKLGLRVAVHATELETARTAVKLGADILVHSVWDKNIVEEFITFLKQNNVIYIPTLMVRKGYRDVFRARLEVSDIEQKFGDPKAFSSFRDILTIPLDKITETHRNMVHLGDNDLPDYEIYSFTNLKKLADAGIIIAAGTDAGNVGTLHGPSLHYELEMMVKAGMKPIDVLIAATKNGSKVMNRPNVGTLTIGNTANLVILENDPLKDITNTRKIYKIMKEGKLYSPNDLCSPILTTDIIDKQLKAYNDHNIEDFIRTYHPKVKIYSLLNNTLLIDGLDELRAQYQNLFTVSPNSHAEIKNRITNGSLVIDLEHTTGRKENIEMNAIVIYEVKNHFITRVWFGR